MKTFTPPTAPPHGAILACANCPSELPEKQSPGDVKDNRFAQRQVSRTVTGVALSEAGPGRELLGPAGETRAEPSGATRGSMAAAGILRRPRSSAQGRLERDAAPLPASSAGRGLPAPFSFPNRPCNLRPCDRRADKKGIQLNGSAWLKVRQSYLFTASKTCGIVQGTDRVTTLSPGVLGLVAPERNCTAEGLERGSLARWARSNLRCLFKPSP